MYLVPRWESHPWNFVTALCLKNLRRCPYQTVRKCNSMSTCLGTILVLDRQMDRWICHNSIALCIHCMLKCDKTVKQRWNFKLGCVIPTGSVRKDLTVQYSHKRTLHNAQRNVQSSDAPDWANYYSDTQDTSLSQQFLLSILLAHQLFNYCERRVAPWSLSQTMYRQALPHTGISIIHWRQH